MKQVQRVELRFDCELDDNLIWQAKASADFLVSLSEYPDMPPKRKGIVIVLTPAQETTILNFIRNSVIQQAEAAK